MAHPYSTITDLQQVLGGSARLIQATDWNNDRQADTDVVDSAIASADAEIDSYVNKQYAVPLGTVPSTIRDVSARLAKFRILSQRGMVDDFVKAEHDSDVKWLEGVRDGLNSLGVEPVPDPASMRVDTSSARPSSKEVSRQKLRGFS